MSISLQADSTLPQGYLKVNGSTAATVTTSGIVANVTGNLTGTADNATAATTLSTSSGSAPNYACRAWVSFDGTKDTNNTTSTANTNRLIRSSGNVASVLRNALGDLTITFTTPLNSANYAVLISVQEISGVAVGMIKAGTTPTSSSFTILTRGTSAAGDLPIVNVAIFGN